jgi:hypothetical protein
VSWPCQLDLVKSKVSAHVKTKDGEQMTSKQAGPHCLLIVYRCYSSTTAFPLVHISAQSEPFLSLKPSNVSHKK